MTVSVEGIPAACGDTGIEYSSVLQDDGAPATADFGNGFNWLSNGVPRVCYTDDNKNEVAVVLDSGRAYWFDVAGDDYTPQHGVTATLAYDESNCKFELKECNGDIWEFNPEGVFLSHVSPGQTASPTVTSYAANGLPETVSCTVTQNGVTTTNTLEYEFDGNDRVIRVTRRRSVNPAADMHRILYTYYGASEPYGSDGDLKTVTIQWMDGLTWTDKDVSYFRYYKSGDANGFEHGLKYGLGPAAYQRLKDDPEVSDPLIASNAQVAQYADNYFEYDGSQRATKSTIQGGLLTYTFAYTTSAFADGYNNWKLKSTTTRPDGSQEIVYSNYITGVMLRDLKSGSDDWIDYYLFNSDAYEIQHAHPSAVTAYDDSVADLNVTLRTNAGLIDVTDYYSTTTATESTAGGVANFVQFTKLKQGSSGTEIKQSETKYFFRSAGGGESYPIAEQTVYRDTAAAQPVTTSYAYTWHTGVTQIEQTTTTFPVISSGQNGTGTPDQQTERFDVYGKRLWLRDPRGFISNFTYDDVTGTMTQQIEDVDGAKVTLPSGWSTPAGGGLNLVTDFEHDATGRTTQALGPAHDVDGQTVRTAEWTVYKDLDDETWLASGYSTGTSPTYQYTLVNPVLIQYASADGRTGRNVSAVRTDTDGPLSAGDAYPQSTWIRWSEDRSNDHSQQTSSRVYHAIPSSGEGVSGDNYDESTFDYDAMNRQNRSVTPGGTISRTVYDVRDMATEEWVGTDDTLATAADPSGGGATGNNMVQRTTNVYDAGADGGDGNLTQATEHVDTDSAKDRDTTYGYDFRNRQTSIDGEIDFYQANTYDNLNRVTVVERKNTTSGGFLIAKSETKFDDLGRTYQTVIWEVDPSTGATGNSLTDNTWYDGSSNVVKSEPSGSGSYTKSAYDGINRVTAT
ncbi:MAG: RHS repeat-associated core domain-containing protein, partial [Acidobacteria bacterium]|nr:RHS repeat-associated core domain-containing protein [Acidobacteriota bacterium]